MLTESIMLAQNKRLREENDELHEIIRQMKGNEEPAPLPDGLPYLTPSLETVFRCLLSRPGGASRHLIYETLYQHDEDRTMQVVQVFVCKLRRLLVGTEYQIVTIRGRGWRLERLEAAA